MSGDVNEDSDDGPPIFGYSFTEDEGEDLYQYYHIEKSVGKNTDKGLTRGFFHYVEDLKLVPPQNIPILPLHG